MYFIPSFIQESNQNKTLYVSSPLYKNVIGLNEDYSKKYFYIKKNHCVDLNGELETFLHE